MKKVILINEENHGLIGVANNYYNAVKWLIEDGWLISFSEIWVEDDRWERIVNIFGENWEDLMLNEWDLDKFNELFQCSFSLDLVDIIGAENE